MTILKAIQEVMKQENKALTDKEAYQLIIKNNLYEFPAKDPVHVVKTTIRRHCLGLDFPTSKKVKYFKIVENNAYADAPRTPSRCSVGHSAGVVSDT